MACGMFLATSREASGKDEDSDWYGEGMGEKESSEKVVLDELGELVPFQPKKVPSLEFPGDLGITGSAFCIVVSELFESYE